jgi:type II restriction enzyme
MRGYKEQYVKQYSEQSWHVFIGNAFEKLIYWVLRAYVSDISGKPELQNITILNEEELKGNEILSRKLAIKYGEYLLLPDTDMVIADCNFSNPWNSEIIAIISCKTSLRERIAQACYWKLKLLASDITKNIRVFLATTDNDDDFLLKDNSKQYGGKSRNRIIAEWELDGIYILRGDFKPEMESEKVKQYEQIFDDLIAILGKIKRTG